MNNPPLQGEVARAARRRGVDFAAPGLPRYGEGDRAKRGGVGSPRALRPEAALARQRRRAMALPGIILWEQLRGRKLGPNFRRQQSIRPHVVDFYCAARGLAIEVDGKVHGRRDQPAQDLRCDEFLKENGYRVLRFAAADILQDLEAATASIVSLVPAPLHHASHGLPPRSGED
nr:endonuclease domain-containing protein [Sphingomonas xinjiangensis]